MNDLDTEEVGEELQKAIAVSDHGIKRVRERLGLPTKAVEKEIDRARQRGKPRHELSGRLRRNLDALFHRYGAYGDYRVYRGCVFVFKDKTFVTVLHLRNGLQNTKAGGRSSQG